MKKCVIISIYKNDKLKYVKEALESIYEQSLKVDIFIKIDGKIDIDLEKWLLEEKEKNKIYYLDKRDINKGLAISLNELIQEGINRGYEYFFRMDADDISNLDRFKKQLQFLEVNTDIDVCGTFIEEFGDGIEYSKIVKYPTTHQEMFEFFKKRVPLAHVSVCFRKSFFQKAGLYPEIGHITNEDTLIWLNGFKNKCIFANIDYIGVKVRVSKDFFNRRANLDKVWYDFKNRIQVIKELNYGIDSYFYAFGILIINLLPVKLKKIAYLILR